jgi:hypothetical protein
MRPNGHGVRSCMSHTKYGAPSQAGSPCILPSLHPMPMQAISFCTAMIRRVQEYYQAVIVPHMLNAAGEERECLKGLNALVRAVDEAIISAMRDCITQFFVRVCGVGRWRGRVEAGGVGSLCLASPIV